MPRLSVEDCAEIGHCWKEGLTSVPRLVNLSGVADDLRTNGDDSNIVVRVKRQCSYCWLIQYKDEFVGAWLDKAEYEKSAGVTISY